MKRLLTICKFALIVVLAGVVLLVVGVLKEMLALTIAGGCLIGAYVLLASVAYVCAIFDSVKRKEEKNGGSKKAAEEEMLEDINTSVGIPNESAVHTRQAATLINAKRHMSAFEKFMVALLGIVMIGGTAAVIALIETDYYVAAICTACGVFVFVGGFILISRLVAKSRLKDGIADETEPPVFGKVESCVMYTETTSTTGINNAYQSTQKTRVLSTIYKLRVRISVPEDGYELGKSDTAEKVVPVFSKNYYDEGDEVKLAKRKGNKRQFVIVE